MATGRLPDHEQRILDEMEEVLRHDRDLNRRTRTTRARWRLREGWEAAEWGRNLFLLLTSVAAAVLLVAGIQTQEPGAIWAFAATWPFAVLGGVVLVRRRRAGRRDGR
ncbi:DUF3040 domain-containing protein [Streptomyces sp. NPDC050560]|uniref:DUF3040 domain-containing protein n=1 Tax=Streptomyces sp. NPDC050560 TaxID=3365630 RepID=UPI0037B0AF5D